MSARRRPCSTPNRRRGACAGTLTCGGPFARLAGQDIPASPGEVAILLHQAFRELAGTDLANDPATSLYLEQYVHGGMSSGMISLQAWRQRLMPMLIERARTRLPGH